MIRFLIKESKSNIIFDDNTPVEDLDDGGMGSIKFTYPVAGVFLKKALDAEYVDSDGVAVSLGLNLDNFGRIYDLDFWKVDFSPLQTYPSPENINSISAYG